MRKVKKKPNLKFSLLVKGIVLVGFVFVLARLYFLFFASNNVNSNIKIGQVISSGNSNLMLDSATYYAEDDMIEVGVAYDTGSLTNPNQLSVKAKQTNNANKKFQVKNVKVSPNYYVFFIPKVNSRHFNISIDIYASPIEKSDKDKSTLMGSTSFETIKLSSKNVSSSNNFKKKSSFEYQKNSTKSFITLQKMKIKKLEYEIKGHNEENHHIQKSSYRMFDNVSQMTYDDVKNLSDYIRDNNQKITQTQSKINQLLDEETKINVKIKAINTVTE